MIESSYLRFLAKNSLFSLIPETLEELAPFMDIEYVVPGQILYRSGSALERLIIPLQSSLSLISEAGVLPLPAGKALSLSSLLRNTPMPFDVTGEEFTKILVLPKKYLLSYLETQKDVFQYLLLLSESESFKKLKAALEEKVTGQNGAFKLSGLIGENVEFHPGLLEEGLLLIEEGRLTIEGEGFSGKFNGGEFVGGFHAFGYPNPGYRIIGDGIVRLIKSDAFAGAGLDREILGYLGNDPWIKREKKSKDFESSTTPIPPDVLVSWPEANLYFDPQEIKPASSDWSANKEVLCFIVRYYDQFCNLPLIENRFTLHSEVFRFSLVAEILEHHGVLSKVTHWKQSPQDLSLPAVIPFGNRIIFILDREENHFCCYDGLLGLVKIQKNFLLDHSQDTALSTRVIAASKEIDGKAPSLSKRRRSLNIIFDVIKTEKQTATRIALLTLGTYALGACSPKLNEILLDEVLRSEDRSTLIMCISGLGLISFFIIAFTFIKNRLITKSSIVLDDILTRFLYSKAQKLKGESYSKLGAGGVLSRLMEISKIRAFFSTESLDVLFSLGSALVYGLLLATYGKSLLLFVLGYFFLISTLLYFGRKKLYRMSLESFNKHEKMNSFIGSSLSSILAVKAFSASSGLAKEWETLSTQLNAYDKQAASFGNLLDSMVNLFGQVIRIAIIWYCIVHLNSTESPLSFGEVFAIIQLITLTISPMGRLAQFFASLEDMKLSFDKINEILLSEDSAASRPGHSFSLSGKIKLEKVSFRYQEASALVLKELTLTIYPGQTVAIVGKSGSGKTTIANLIAQDSSPTSGRILYDNIDASFIDPSEVKLHIGHIHQSNKLFSGSIRSNVAFKDESPDLERLAAVYSLANCDKFLQALPQRDETYLAEGGMGLSEGQKQRIAMARTLYQNPKIMIFDEATSALDPQSEGAIVDRLIGNKGQVTTIIIAHRLSTIRNADYIFVIDDGELVQEGIHNDLIKRPGVYQDLFQDQAS